MAKAFSVLLWVMSGLAASCVLAFLCEKFTDIFLFFHPWWLVPNTLCFLQVQKFESRMQGFCAGTNTTTTPESQSLLEIKRGGLCALVSRWKQSFSSCSFSPFPIQGEKRGDCALYSFSSATKQAAAALFGDLPHLTVPSAEKRSLLTPPPRKSSCVNRFVSLDAMLCLGLCFSSEECKLETF